MEHAVFYQSTQGTPAFRRLASLEDAVSFAEHLRNVEGVTDFSVYALTPVTLSLRAYYHVEVAPADAAAAPAATAQPVASEPVAASPAPDGADAATETDPAAVGAGAAQEASEPDVPQGGYSPGMPFAAAPPVTSPSGPSDSAQYETEPLPEPAARGPVDPSVVDPTVEEVVPSGRRSMGFFARS